MATRVKQRDPLHSWYPHEGLYPQPIRLTSHRLLIVCLLAVGLGGTIGVIVVILSSGF